MTREEAREALQEQIDKYGQEYDDKGIEALEMAIEALKPKPMQKFDNVKQHIDRLAGDYKCWDERLSHEEALELSRMLEQQPCEDAISREAAIDAMYNLCDTGETLRENPWRDNPHIDAIIDVIGDLPSVAPQQKVGKWIAVENEEMETIGYYCSECDLPMETEQRTFFCPNCGTKMGESKEP